MKKIVSLIIVCAVALSAAAVPAKRGGIVRTTADGTEKTVYLYGDAFNHHMTDAEGNWLDETTLQPLSAEAKAERQVVSPRANARRIIQEKKAAVPLNLAPRGLLIMVNFSDLAFTTPADTIHEMVNGENFSRSFTYTEGGYSFSVKASGSARQYFHDQSWGQYNPQFDAVGPFTVSKSYSYYGGNNKSGDDQNVGLMIKEACELADAAGVDFTLYDNNNDGEVDFVYVLYAGYGEADGGDAETIWPHNFYLKDGCGINCTLDGKVINNYACSNELNYSSKLYTGIGTLCHEFSHVLGLPDLYSTNNATHKTMGEWDVLDYGPYNNLGNTPPAYSAYERFFMGWLKPTVMTDPRYVYLNPLNDSKEALLLCTGDAHDLVGNNPNPTEFYLLENRKKEGWDQYLPGKGLLITHVKYNYSKWVGNTVNNSASAMGVDLVEADGSAPTYNEYNPNNGYMGKAKDAFPAGAKNWLAFENHEVSSITLTAATGVVGFSYRYGTQDVEKIETGEAAQKILRDGQILIIRGGKTYDLNGRAL